MNRVLWMLLLATFSVFSVSCGSARKARKARKMEAARKADSLAAATRTIDSLLTSSTASSPTADTVETAVLDPSKTAAPPFLLSLHGRTTYFRTFTGKARMQYKSGDKSHDFTSTFRIRRDSAIWISVVAVGGLVPVARVLITPDSLLAINYLQREAYRMPLAEAGRLLPLPAQFAQLQNLLLGNVLEPAAPIISTGKTETEQLYFVATRGNGVDYTAFYGMADSTLLGEQSKAQDGGLEMMVKYRKYEPDADKRFAVEREIVIRLKGERTELQQHIITMDFTDPPRFDTPLDFSFSIPKNYTLK